jgi:hypothetical protein
MHCELLKKMNPALKTLAAPLTLFLANLYICRDLFRVEWLRHMGSIEGAYIGISRYALAHWGDLSWFPLWYNGVPYQNTYPPLLHLGVAFVAWIFGFTPQHAHHFVTALAYCLGPITLYALALRLSGSRWTAFAAGLFYSFLSTSAWLIPAVANDLGSRLYPRRLQALVYYGEGPHISAMTLLPLAVLMIDIAVARRKAVWFTLAAICVAAPVLTNWLAAFALAIMMISYVLSRVGAKGWNWRELALLALIGLAAYGLAMPLAPPSTIAVTQHNAQVIGGDYRLVYQALPRWVAVIVIALVWIKVSMRRLPPQFQFATLFAFLISLLTLASAWFDISIMPQPVRYHLEMEMALALLIPLGAAAILKRFPRVIAIAAIAVFALVLLQPIRQYRRYARDTLIRTIDITGTTEWKTAQWLKSNAPTDRILLSGSNAFWLTAFCDVPELTGGFEQGLVQDPIREGVYQIYTGAASGDHETEWSLLWLKAFGVQLVNVTGPASAEFYHPFAHPKKFDGVLQAMWRDGDDAVYRVQSRPFAHVIPRAALAAREPINGIDVDPLRPYVAALEDPGLPRASFDWTSMHSAHIAANPAHDQVVSIQIAWHPGWRASVNGRNTPILRDAIGLMYIDAQGFGSAEIDLVYDGGREMRFAFWISTLTAIVLALASARGILKKSW